MKKENIVNLDLPPENRWNFLADAKNEMNELFQCYLKDFEGADYLFEGISEFGNGSISSHYTEEIQYISSLTDFSFNEVLLVNLYYDVLKFYFGCTAFGIKSKGKIFHARNLDWWTDNDALEKHTRIFNFQKNGKTIFKSVGWPGFVGVLSGIKPGCFSITLNAVLSNDSPQIAAPISFYLRDVLESSTTYNQAKEKLETTDIASDCLLLITGTKSGEMAVIERTPKRHATRYSENNFIVVTNDYKVLENSAGAKNELATTSCGRFNRACDMLQTELPDSMESCMNILCDPHVKMGITVQQMVFDAEVGKILLKESNA